MSKDGGADDRTRRPVEEIPVLTEVVDDLQAKAHARSAEADALAAQIERAVLEELTPRLEDAVHQAVRDAVERAFAARDAKNTAP